MRQVMQGDKCLFCEIQRNDRERIISENQLAYSVRDGFPVTRHHTLFIPKRHTLDFFGLTSEELVAIQGLINEQRQLIVSLDPTVNGFNVGINCGEVAGQTIWHCHVHLIPRREGDVKAPKGGVRNIIAGKGDYSGDPLSVEKL